MSDYVLATFAVYQNPRDFPGEFVVRRWVGVNGEAVPDAQPLYRGKSLEDVRRHLPPGLYNLGRYPGDDPCIVEVWI